MGEPELKDAIFLLLGNKIDLPNAMSQDELTLALEAAAFPPTVTW